jgi:hypothetical protein
VLKGRNADFGCSDIGGKKLLRIVSLFLSFAAPPEDLSVSSFSA